MPPASRAPTPPPATDAARRRDPIADAIVVLGCRVRGGEASAALKRRVARAVALYRDGAAPLLLLSGGGAGAPPEAELMHSLARTAGVPEAALILECRSRNTNENAREAARLLHRRGLRRIVLVSDRTHLPRAALLFRLAGLAVLARVAPPRGPLAAEAAAALHEIAAWPRSLVRALRR